MTESYTSDRNKLRMIFKQLKNIFGEFPEKSIIVLATKRNDANPKMAKKRRKSILKVMEEF